jgi:hypothetical protein
MFDRQQVNEAGFSRKCLRIAVRFFSPSRFPKNPLPENIRKGRGRGSGENSPARRKFVLAESSGRSVSRVENISGER